MTLPLVLKTYNADGPFLEPADADQQWIKIQDAVNELYTTKLSGIGYQERTANTPLAEADNGTWIKITSGAFSQGFSAVAALGAGWFVILQNAGTGFITLDPGAAETIDGLASFIMYPGEMRVIQCDGAGLHSIVLNSFEVEFSESGNFIRPPGYREFDGVIWGGGASGSRSVGGVHGGGGGAGFPFKIPAGKLDAVHAYTVGSGGPARGGTSSSGAPGGDSQLVPGISSQGGRAPASSGSYSDGGAASINGNATIFGPSTSSATLYGGQRSALVDMGMNHYGGGAGGSYDSTGGYLRLPGDSLYGGAGGAASSDSSAEDGKPRGGGGGGCRSSDPAHTSGKGGDGALLIRGII